MGQVPRDLVAFGVVAIAAAGVLFAMGRVPWCKCGSPVPWSWEVWSMHNSQHLLDPYAFTHMLHGVVFAGALYVALGSYRDKLGFAVALVIEAAWEILENTPMVIDRYRENTASLDYFGDSIANSVADLGWCALGYVIARRVGWKWSVAGFLAVELILAATIRDTLMLNVLMLIWPVDAVRDWQLAGAPTPG